MNLSKIIIKKYSNIIIEIVKVLDKYYSWLQYKDKSFVSKGEGYGREYGVRFEFDEIETFAELEIIN